MPPELVGEHGVRIGSQLVVGQEIMIRGDCVQHPLPIRSRWEDSGARQTLPAVNAALHFSSFACFLGFLANPMAMSAMCVTTHWKYSGVSELTSMSGAGFMKSIA